MRPAREEKKMFDKEIGLGESVNFERVSCNSESTGSESPFCQNCQETDCAVSLDETCSMIRRYLKAAKDGVHVCEFGKENKCMVCGTPFIPNDLARPRRQ